MNSVENQIKILVDKKYQFSPNKCPPEITLEMLIHEMKCSDLNVETATKEYLWKIYYSVVFPPNRFGITADIKDKTTELFILKDPKTPIELNYEVDEINLNEV